MFDVLKFAALGGAFAGAAAAGSLEELPAVPSGFDYSVQEVIFDAIGNQQRARFRVVMPAVAAHPFDMVEADFTTLCEDLAVPELSRYQRNFESVVISIADRETEFGVANAEATQYFEAFTLENGTCIWEAF